MSNLRKEHDSLGAIDVPKDKLWGSQTQRSLINFNIGKERVHLELIRGVAAYKWAAASANCQCKKLDVKRANLIKKVCEEIIAGKLDEHFPTKAYQAGSGTQTNMNVNEVIAHRANQIAHQHLIHPNDHCNMSQSTNDVYPTAMNICALWLIEHELLPAVDKLIDSFDDLEKKSKKIVKMGRTHIQDALPITFGQEVSGWKHALITTRKMIVHASHSFYETNFGGTAVGTGFGAPKKFDQYGINYLKKILKNNKFFLTTNKFHGTWSKDAFVYCHGAIKAMACDLYKIAQDIRFLASGPRSGFNELILPSNEPGSSIMPGKVNPTQCEGMSMICAQVMGHDTTISYLASQGNFELNTFGTILMQNFIQSVTLFSQTINSFNFNCVKGIVVNTERMDALVQNSLMLVTALASKIGYEKSAYIAKLATKENLTLREAAIMSGYVSAAEYDKIVNHKKMV